MAKSPFEKHREIAAAAGVLRVVRRQQRIAIRLIDRHFHLQFRPWQQADPQDRIRPREILAADTGCRGARVSKQSRLDLEMSRVQGVRTVGLVRPVGVQVAQQVVRHRVEQVVGGFVRRGCRRCARQTKAGG